MKSLSAQDISITSSVGQLWRNKMQKCLYQLTLGEKQIHNCVYEKYAYIHYAANRKPTTLLTTCCSQADS